MAWKLMPDDGCVHCVSLVPGCLLDIDRREYIFWRNGTRMSVPVYEEFFNSTKESGFFAAASFMTFQHCRFNFGLTEFRYPPKDREFKSLNDCEELTPGLPMIVPRHARLKRSSDGKS